ncbi:alpha/beta hydrolase-fold protein [Segetibacter koreensis]|uniref:alpha/beta hydrolase-fold protein n=1 Tax=Segetibacter koreensis TaxID=398037 RepID=UPI00035DEE99|nr:alpha/beta hydrolase-fold protein [Segetibacter koreensis]
MDHTFKTTFYLILFVLLYSSTIAQKFSIRYTPAASRQNFTGNVFLYLSKENKNPKDADVGIEFFPCYRIAVKNIKPNQAVLFDDAAVSYPVPLSAIERTEYYVQAVWDRNLGDRSIGNSAGNMYNKSVKTRFTKKKDEVFNLLCDDVIKEQSFVETQYSKEIKASSSVLTAFYKRPTTINAAVLLPKEYDEQPERKFPVLYWVSGYGHDYHDFSGKNDPASPMDTTACIRVFLDGNCSLGHSVYANSDNNGPWSDALIKELLPEVEKKFRCNAAKLLTGHSSGGWTVIWLQTHYPKTFIACWSSAPDPVDFRNLQQIDLYKDHNLFYANDSSLRMTATVAGRIPWASMKQVYQMENIISRGEQAHSFDAVFSQKNLDGSPRKLCNPNTGEIDSVTVSHWKNYDICLYLRDNWNRIKTELDGKVRVSVGEQDNFLLNYAVHLLDEEMKKLKSGFVFAYYPGDHFTVSTSKYKSDGYKFLQQKYNQFIAHLIR